jgi:hypothetical protein
MLPGIRFSVWTNSNLFFFFFKKKKFNFYNSFKEIKFNSFLNNNYITSTVLRVSFTFLHLLHVLDYTDKK